ncbi:hypothetical protein SDC9_170523 [bioreactor metagenome]|uniref:Uncharacterized protein n=1 Tax=bioreactor metagenome TaxID=1076179 RepID=A0A645GAI1_9ZZZZ
MAPVGCCIYKDVVRPFFKPSLYESLEELILHLKMFKREIIHKNNKLVVSVFYDIYYCLKVFDLVFVYLDHPESLGGKTVQKSFHCG